VGERLAAELVVGLNLLLALAPLRKVGVDGDPRADQRDGKDWDA